MYDLWAHYLHKILAGCGGSVSLLVRPMFTLLYFTLLSSPKCCASGCTSQTPPTPLPASAQPAPPSQRHRALLGATCALPSGVGRALYWAPGLAIGGGLDARAIARLAPILARAEVGSAGDRALLAERHCAHTVFELACDLRVPLRRVDRAANAAGGVHICGLARGGIDPYLAAEVVARLAVARRDAHNVPLDPDQARQIEIERD